MRYFVELTENEAEMLEENETIYLSLGSVGGTFNDVFGKTESWLLYRSNLLDRPSED